MHISRIFLRILPLAVLFCAAACAEIPASGDTADIPAAESVSVSVPTPDSASDSPAESVQGTESGELWKITRPDLMIYTEPGYDASDTGNLLPPGTYTVVEEKKDADGILWGKLKSGAGWIDLDRAAEAAHIPLTAESADERKLSGMTYTEPVLSDSKYAQRILFRAHEDLTGIRFSALSYLEDSFESVGNVYTQPALRAGEGFVVNVVFPGDLSMYGITCTDAGGAEHRYMLYISGRNGSLIMEEYGK